jgi:2-keto-4-pentenoate hydratase/2-oxohepta-3-ene-1,7-dioic acid hydratase in catechol pathway
MTTADEITDPQNLAIKCRLNGELMQDSHTSDMVFSIANMISYLSQSSTLLPGTLILTGTPEGVGFTRKPRVFLAPGDRVEVEIEGIGVLENPVEKEE